MLLTRFIKNVFDYEGASSAPLSVATANGPSVLNVGGNSKQIALPGHYAGWNHYLLDIAEGPDVDIVLDARKLQNLEAAQFDAIYCSHNLEHYHPHEVGQVLAGFLHVLKPQGHAEIRVPDIAALLRVVVERNLELDDILYISSAGPMSPHDMIYGWGKEIERSGVDFFAHKRGFSAKSLVKSLTNAGFASTMTRVGEGMLELVAYAFKSVPTHEQRIALLAS